MNETGSSRTTETGARTTTGSGRGEAFPGGAGATAADDAAAGELLTTGDREQMTRRWQDIQAAFVDQPQRAVQEADALVAELLQHLTEGFAAERQQLETQWSRGDHVSTEDLRVSLQRYRSFFRRLLSV